MGPISKTSQECRTIIVLEQRFYGDSPAIAVIRGPNGDSAGFSRASLILASRYSPITATTAFAMVRGDREILARQLSQIAVHHLAHKGDGPNRAQPM